MADASGSQGSKAPLRALSRNPKIQTIVVAVPNAAGPNPWEWQDRNGLQWLRNIPSTVAPGLAVFSLDLEVKSSEASTWPMIQEKGNVLLSGLLNLIENEKLQHCPIILMSHGFGGFVVKEALRRAYQRPSSFRDLLQAMAGVILMGTPHSISEDTRTWESTALLLQTGVLLKKKGLIDKDDIERFAKFSLEFEQACVLIPILSAYELHPTKIKNSLVSTKKVFFTSKDFVFTKSRREELLGVSSDHKNLCNVRVGSKEFTELVKFLTVVLEEARLRIISGSPHYKAASVLDHWTNDESHEPLLSRSQSDDRGTPAGKLPPPSWRNKSEDSSGVRSDPRTKDGTAGSSDGGFEIIPQLFEFSSTRQGSRLPCHILPVARNKEFFGRADVLQHIHETFFPSAERMEDALEDGTKEAKTFAICGPGGMGKTQTAAEFVFTHKNRFDAIFWIFAATAEKIYKSFSEIALKLGLVDHNSVDLRDPVVIRDLVKGWLATPLKTSDPSDEGLDDYASWLLIFDNADNLEELEDVWPLDGPGCVLLTSRDPLATHSGYLGMAGIDLKPFGAQEGKNFLNRLTGKEGDSNDIIKVLDGLPLAITQMAGVIVRRNLTYGEFLKTYNEEDGRKEMLQLRLGQRHRKTGYEYTVASVWALESLKCGRTLLEILSFLDPDGIPEAMLTKPESVSLDNFPKSLSSYYTARTELLQSSLISKTSETIQVHRLVQDVARTKLTQSKMEETFSATVKLVALVWPFEAFGWRHSVARWRVCEALFPHVLMLKHHYDRLNLSLKSFEADVGFAKLLTDAGWYSHESGRSVDSKPFFANAQSIAERLLSPLSDTLRSQGCENPVHGQLESLLAEIHHNFGCVSSETNDPKGALTHFKTFNDLMVRRANENEEGEKDKQLAISWNELGNGYMLNEMWEKGRDSFLESIHTMQRVADFRWTHVSLPFVNLGLAYWLMGQLDEAMAVLSEGLKHRENQFGVDDKESFVTGRFLHALGNVKGAQDLMEESHNYHKRALSQYLSTIGSNHHRTGDVYVKMADHRFFLQQYEQALSYINQALCIFSPRPVLKPENARALFKRSAILSALGRLDEAAESQEESLKLYYEIHESRGITKRRSMDLGIADFDRIIAFWSK